MLAGDSLPHPHFPPRSSPQLSNSEQGSQRREPSRNQPISAPHSEGEGEGHGEGLFHSLRAAPPLPPSRPAPLIPRQPP